MCGIAGLVRLDGSTADRLALEAMNQRLAHRGPDGDGLWLEGPAGLAHRRLSIIDLATGDQPMRREDLGRTVIFNGEIYNYLELRAELEALGRRFHTKSDTEVLLVGHAEWGDGLLARLRGMFAFALWESGPRRLLLARDPLGKKPLQVCFLPGRLFAFASEAKALFALGEVSRRIEPQAIAAFLDWMYVPEQLRLYRDVERLQAGEWLALQDGRVTRGRYAPDLPPAPPGEIEALSFDAACARVEAAVREAVRLRLRSDVPLGVFLSGGVDSSLVALQAAALVPGKLRTFTVGFPGAADERPWARRAAAAIGAEHTELEVELDAPALAAEVARHWDEPFGDSSAVPMLAIARATRSAVKVVLSGDGGDEIFAGYGTYLRQLGGGSAGGPRAPWRRLLGTSVRLLERGARRLPPRLAAAAAALSRPLRPGFDAASDGALADPLLLHLSLQRIPHAAPGMLAPLLGGAASDPGALLAGVPEGLPRLRAALRLDRSLYLPGDILKKVDIASMRFGLEVRSPLLDDALIALADRLPPGFLAARLPGPRGTWGKRPLKALVARALGDDFAYRPKQGFGAPLQAWLADPRFVARIEEGFASASTPLRDWFTPGALARAFRDFRGGKRWLAQEVWNLLMLDAWAREARPA